MGAGCGQVVQDAGRWLPAFGVPTGAGGRGCSCYFANVSKNGQNPILLPAFPLCLWWIGCKYAFISHFKAVFSAFWGGRVGLYRFGALRGLWGFCARV